MLKSLLLLLICTMSFGSYAQKDEAIFNKILETKKRIGQTQILDIAKAFLGCPYQSHTLEINTEEKLVTNLSNFDCQTLVESTIAIHNVLNNSRSDFSSFKNELVQLRYRNAKIEGYASRIHYFSEWLFEQEKNGGLLIKNFEGISEKLQKKLNFISQNAQLYKQLSDKNILTKIQSIENEISKREIPFVPKNKITKVIDQIEDGDLIVFTTALNNLDVVHEGFACRIGEQIHLLHASLDLKKVVISNENLVTYLLKHPKMTGIIVAKIL